MFIFVFVVDLFGGTGVMSVLSLLQGSNAVYVDIDPQQKSMAMKILQRELAAAVAAETAAKTTCVTSTRTQISTTTAPSSAAVILAPPQEKEPTTIIKKKPVLENQSASSASSTGDKELDLQNISSSMVHTPPNVARANVDDGILARNELSHPSLPDSMPDTNGGETQVNPMSPHPDESSKPAHPVNLDKEMYDLLSVIPETVAK